MNSKPADYLLKPVQHRLMIPLVSGLLVLIAGFVITLVLLHNKQLSLNSQQQIGASIHTLELAIDSQTRLLMTLHELILNDNEDIVPLLQNHQRSKLLDRFQAYFQSLHSTHGITHFYFHTTDGINLLRLHQPARFGDKVERFLLNQARQSGLVTSGFELDKSGSFVLRVVKPVISQDSIVGYLELGSEINGLLSKLHSQENVEAAFLVHKSAIPPEIRETLKSQQSTSNLWNQFDKFLLIHTSTPGLVEVLDSLVETVHRHGDEYQHQFIVNPGYISNMQHLHYPGITHDTSFQGQPALLSFIPFTGATGDAIADLLLLINTDLPTSLFYQSTVTSVAIASLIFIILVGFLGVFLKKVDQGISQQQVELINTYDRLDKAISVAKDGVWDWNLKTQRVTFDERYYSMAGYHPGEFHSSYKEWAKRIHPDDAGRVERTVSDYLQQRTEHYDVEFRFQRKDGSFMWIRARGMIFERDDDGKPLRFVGTHSDVTKRKLAQQSVANSEEKFRNLVETSFDWVWEVNAQGVYTYASPRCVDLLGYQPEEIIGKTPFDLMPEKEAERVRQEFERLVANEAFIDSLVNINLHKDGQAVVLETSGIPFFDPEGKLAGYRGIDRDITERKLAEQALRESESRYRAVFNQQYQFAALLSEDGITLEVNDLPLKMAGFERKQVLGKPFWLTPFWSGMQEWEGIWKQRMQDARTTGRPQHSQDVYQTRTGDKRYADSTTTAIFNDDGGLMFYLIQASDTTDRIPT